MKNNNKKGLVITIVASMLFGAALMYGIFYFFPIGRSTVVNKSEKEVTVTDAGIADSVEKLYDAVVVVEAYQNKAIKSAGSGFVYKKADGKAYIVTNNHVIDGATDVYVTFTNNKKEKVTLVGSDVYSDIAVLTLKDADDIVAAELGKSADMRLGDTVFTIGAPVSSLYSGTITRGILSGKDRMIETSIKSTNDYVIKAIQTDAAINSGNSGGPIANSNGEVIGITSMKLVSTSVEGIGFAIPMEDVLEYTKKIENKEKIERPFLGISMIDLNDLYSLYVADIDVPEGAYGVAIAEVVDDSAASKGGLKAKDIIYKVGNTEVKSIAELRYYLYKYQPGDNVEITYSRDNAPHTTKVKLTSSNN